MRAIKKILLAVDILEPNKLTAEYACTLAKNFDAEVTAFYVTPPTAQYARYATEKAALDNLDREIKGEAEKAMNSIIEKAKQDFSIEMKSALINGSAAKEIVNFAKKNNFDVIVMGTRGKSGLEGVLLGSVASKVIRTSPVPVLTVNPE